MVNQVGHNNLIWFNGRYGVEVSDSTTTCITITQNSISANDSGGIHLMGGANHQAIPPIVTGQNPLRGTTVPGGVVEVFSDSAGQGMCFEGSAAADTAGYWQLEGSLNGPFITATSTDSAGNTSGFSDSLVVVISVVKTSISIPGTPYLAQNYPNPFNPTTTIAFGLARSGPVKLVLYNLLGQRIRIIADRPLEAGHHKLTLHAGGLASGVYILHLSAGDFRTVRKMVITQ
jgi:hypothetical protein